MRIGDAPAAQSGRRRTGLMCAAALAGLAPAALHAAPAFAQTPAAPPQEVLRFRDDQPIEIPEYGDVRCTVEPARPAERPAPDVEVLESVAVEGALAVPASAFQMEWAGLVGKNVSGEVMDRVAARVACLYRERGYLFARVRVERWAAGRYALRVNEGRLDGIEVDGGDPKARAFVERAFGHLKPGEALRLADVRRGLTTARGYGFWAVRPMARRSRTDPDAVVLVLSVTPPKPSVFVSAQNASAETVGTWSAGAAVIGNGLTPLYERTTLGVFHGLTDDRQRGVQLSSDALLTKGGLGLRGDLAWFEQTPRETPPNQDTRGVTKLARAELSAPFAAAPDRIAHWRVGVEAVDQDTALISTGAPTADDSLRVLYAGMRMDARRGPVEGMGQLTVRQGLSAMGASAAGDPLLSRPEANPQATVVRFDAQGARPLGEGLVKVRARGQWAGDPLLQFEEFTWGGLAGGRGLAPGALYGDSGMAATVELHGKKLVPADRWAVTPVAFVEGARTWNEDTTGPARGSSLFGGAGARLSFDERIHLDVAYAHPLTETRGAAQGMAGPRWSVGLSAGFEIAW